MKNVLFYEKGKDSEVITTSSRVFTQKWATICDARLYNNIDITLIKGRLKVVYNTGNSVIPEEDGLAKLIGHIYVEFGGQYIRGQYGCSLQQLVLYNQHITGEDPDFGLKNDQPSNLPNQKNVTGYVDFFFSPTLHPDDPKQSTPCFYGKDAPYMFYSIHSGWSFQSCMGKGYEVLPSTNLEITEQYGWTSRNIPYTEGYKEIKPTNQIKLFPHLNYGLRPLIVDKDYDTQVSTIYMPYGTTIRNILLISKDYEGIRNSSILKEIAIVRRNGTYILEPISFERAQKKSGIKRQKGCLLLNFTNGLYLERSEDAIIRITFNRAGYVEYVIDHLVQGKFTVAT